MKFVHLFLPHELEPKFCDNIIFDAIYKIILKWIIEIFLEFSFILDSHDIVKF